MENLRKVLIALLEDKKELRKTLSEKMLAKEKAFEFLSQTTLPIEGYINIAFYVSKLSEIPTSDLLSILSEEKLKKAIGCALSGEDITQLVHPFILAQAIDKKLLSHALFQFAKGVKTAIRLSMRALTEKNRASIIPGDLFITDNTLCTMIGKKSYSISMQEDLPWTHNEQHISLKDLLITVSSKRTVEAIVLFEKEKISVTFKMVSKHLPDNGKNYPFCEITLKSGKKEHTCAFELSVLQENPHLISWQILQFKNIPQKDDGLFRW